MDNKIKIKKLKKADYMKFYNSLKKAREVNDHGLFVLLRAPSSFKETKNFLAQDNLGGFAIEPNGELISIHKNNAIAKLLNKKHILPQLVEHAFKNGATKGDCYGDFLANYYMQCGFIVVAKVPFKYVEDNPSNWNFKQFGEPFDYILARAVFNKKEYKKLKKQNGFIKLSDIEPYVKEFKDYTTALSYRDTILEDLKNLSYNEVIDYIKKNKDNKD